MNSMAPLQLKIIEMSHFQKLNSFNNYIGSNTVGANFCSINFSGQWHSHTIINVLLKLIRTTFYIKGGSNTKSKTSYIYKLLSFRIAIFLDISSIINVVAFLIIIKQAITVF